MDDYFPLDSNELEHENKIVLKGVSKLRYLFQIKHSLPFGILSVTLKKNYFCSICRNE
jgi:hypothetical protein